MHVARVVSPVSSRESWTVLGDEDAPVDRYLAYLTDRAVTELDYWHRRDEPPLTFRWRLTRWCRPALDLTTHRAASWPPSLTTDSRPRIPGHSDQCGIAQLGVGRRTRSFAASRPNCQQ